MIENVNYKYSGMKWNGFVPKDWEICKVKDKFVRKNSKAFDNDPIILSLARIGVKIRDISTNDGQIAASYYEYNPVEKDDLLLNPMDIQSGANCSISNVEGVISPAYINLKHKRNVDPLFFDFYFKYQYWSMAFFTYGKGVSYENRWTLNTDTLMNYKLIVPPYSEQKAISRFLKEKCNKIDNLLESLDDEIKTLIDYKNSVINEAVTKGINKNIDYKSTNIEWMNSIPKHWQIIPNKFIMHKIKKIIPVYSGEPILSLTMNGVIERDLDAGGKMPSSFDGYQEVYNNNLLMCLFDIDVTPRCIGIVEKNGITSPAYSQFVVHAGYDPLFYYYYYLMLDNDKTLLHLAKNLRHSLTEEQLGFVSVPVPPYSEQKAISRFLKEKCNKIDEIIREKEEQKNRIELYRRSVVYEYVTGKKRLEVEYE